MENSRPEVFLKKRVLKINMLQIFKRTPMSKCGFNKVANHTSA